MIEDEGDGEGTRRPSMAEKEHRRSSMRPAKMNSREMPPSEARWVSKSSSSQFTMVELGESESAREMAEKSSGGCVEANTCDGEVSVEAGDGSESDALQKGDDEVLSRPMMGTICVSLLNGPDETVPK